MKVSGVIDEETERPAEDPVARASGKE